MAEQHEKALVPQIRFTGFTDPWEQRKLGKVGITYSGLHGKTKDDFGHGDAFFVPYTNVFDNPVTDQGRLEHVEVDSSQAEVKHGDVFFTVSSETPEEVGMSSIWLGNIRNVYLNSFCFGYRQDGSFDSLYLAYVLRSQSVRKQIELLAQGISRFNISKNKVMNVEVPKPSLGEQRRIGAFLDRLDSLITLHQRKYDKLCVLKKSMLDKMFPKGGSLYPEIRFAGFTDPWEQRKLGEVASGFEYGLNAAASDFDGEKKYLRITDIDDQTREFRTDDLSSPDINNPIDDRYLLKEGDILFARTGASVGKTYLYKASDGKTYYAGFLIRAHVSDEADAGFIFQSTLTERYKQFVLLTSQRSGQPGINAQEYSDLLLPLPSLMEQRRIGAFFDRLDSLITLHQRKLELLRNIKKSMLDKMFV